MYSVSGWADWVTCSFACTMGKAALFQSIRHRPSCCQETYHDSPPDVFFSGIFSLCFLASPSVLVRSINEYRIWVISMCQIVYDFCNLPLQLSSSILDNSVRLNSLWSEEYCSLRFNPSERSESKWKKAEKSLLGKIGTADCGKGWRHRGCGWD